MFGDTGYSMKKYLGLVVIIIVGILFVVALAAIGGGDIF